MRELLDNLFKRPLRKEVFNYGGGTITVAQIYKDTVVSYSVSPFNKDNAMFVIEGCSLSHLIINRNTFSPEKIMLEIVNADSNLSSDEVDYIFNNYQKVFSVN